MDFFLWLWYYIFTLVWEKITCNETFIEWKNSKEKTKIIRINIKKIIIDQKENGTIILKFSTDLKINVREIEIRSVI